MILAITNGWTCVLVATYFRVLLNEQYAENIGRILGLEQFLGLAAGVWMARNAQKDTYIAMYRRWFQPIVILDMSIFIGITCLGDANVILRIFGLALARGFVGSIISFVYEDLFNHRFAKTNLSKWSGKCKEVSGTGAIIGSLLCILIGDLLPISWCLWIQCAGYIVASVVDLILYPHLRVREGEDAE